MNEKIRDAKRLIFALKAMPVSENGNAARERTIGFISGLLVGDALSLK